MDVRAARRKVTGVRLDRVVLLAASGVKSICSLLLLAGRINFLHDGQFAVRLLRL